MGIAFITAKAKKFKPRRDAAYEDQVASENLFSGLPEAIAQTYRCKCSCAELPEVGTPVLLYSSGSGIRVLHMNQEIGRVMSPDSADVKSLMTEAQTAMLPAQVAGARPMSSVFLVQLHGPVA